MSITGVMQSDGEEGLKSRDMKDGKKGCPTGIQIVRSSTNGASGKTHHAFLDESGSTNGVKVKEGDTMDTWTGALGQNARTKAGYGGVLSAGDLLL